MVKYFTALNYSLGDEDTSVELGMLHEHAEHVMAVAGSGGRVIPLLARAPKRLTCVDILDEQLALTRMRIEALRALSHESFTGFLGYPPHAMCAAKREKVFRGLSLTDRDRDYLEKVFSANSWQPIIYLGKFERAMIKLSKIVRLFVGKRGLAVFDFQDQEAQRNYYRERFPHTAWKAVLFLIGNSAVLNSILYKGDFPKKNIPRSAFAIYRDIFHRLLCDLPARESFFLQLVFLGGLVYPEGNPIECDPAVFTAAKQALQHTPIDYHCGDVIEALDGSVDFLSLSDVPSFFQDPDLERNFLQRSREKLSTGGVLVYRGHLRLPHPETTGFHSIIEPYQALVDREKTQLWQRFAYRKTEE